MISQVFRGVFFICEKFPSFLNLLVFFPDILISCDREFVFRFRARAGCRGSVIVQKKRELSQKAKYLVVGDLEIFPKKSLHREREREIL